MQKKQAGKRQKWAAVCVIVLCGLLAPGTYWLCGGGEAYAQEKGQPQDHAYIAAEEPSPGSAQDFSGVQEGAGQQDDAVIRREGAAQQEGAAYQESTGQQDDTATRDDMMIRDGAVSQEDMAAKGASVSPGGTAPQQQGPPPLKGYENTIRGVTGPDGQVISGYTWEMYDAKIKEKMKEGIRLVFGMDQIKFPDQKPVMDEGRVLVPMRPVFESVYVQCRVYWDVEFGKATVLDQKGRQVVFVPGESSYTVIGAEGSQKEYPLDVPAKIVDGRVLLPLRALLETFEYKVCWYGDEQMIQVFDRYPSWRKLMKPDEWQRALDGDCKPCALVKEAP
jgi:hypothetical protein